MFGAGGLTHADCRRPRVLSTEERALLFLHCGAHSVECAPCVNSFHLSELGSDLRGHTNLCPHCRQDLTDGVRAHLYKCDMVSETVRRRVQAVRAASERLVKESYEPGDAADVLRREVELRSTLFGKPCGNRPKAIPRPTPVPGFDDVLLLTLGIAHLGIACSGSSSGPA